MYGYYRGASHPRGGREGPYVMRTHACSVFNHVYVLREAFRNGKYLVRLTECVEGEAAVSDRLGEVSSEFPTVPKQKLPRKEEEEEKKTNRHPYFTFKTIRNKSDTTQLPEQCHLKQQTLHLRTNKIYTGRICHNIKL